MTTPGPGAALPTPLREPVRKVRTFLEMVKFSHTVFALPFAAAGLLLPTGEIPGTQVLLWVLVAMVGARTAAMSFNRLADAGYDAANPRTADRALPAGSLSRRFVFVAMVLSVGAFAAATWKLNPLCFALAPPTVLVLLGYSLTKRFTFLSHFALGLALGISPCGAYLAVTGAFDPGFAAPLLLGIAVVLWVAGFDIVYSCQDVDFDRAEGLHSMPVSFGVPAALRVAAWLHVLTVAALLLFGWFGEFGSFFFLSVGIVAVLLVVEHRLVSPDDFGSVNIAFFNINAAISLLVLAGVVADLKLPGALAALWREGLIPVFGKPDPFIIVGIMLLAGHMLGEAATKVKIPRITGYLVAGILLGPEGLGLLLPPETAGTLPDFLAPGEVMAKIALGIIVFTVGLQVDLWEIVENPKSVLLGVAESLVAGAAVTGALYWIGWDFRLAAALGAMAMSSSPAVVLLVRRELHADGPIVRRILTTVGLNNLLSFAVFALVLPPASAALGEDSGAYWRKWLYVLLGSFGLGTILGAITGWLEAVLGKDLGIFLLRVGVVLAGLGLAGQFGLSPLFLLLATGMAAECFAKWKKRDLRVDFGRAEVAFFIVLFVVSGTHIHFSRLAEAGLAGLLFVLARILGKSAGVFAAAGTAGIQGWRHRASVSLCLVPMAGMAIGLTHALHEGFPGDPRAEAMAALVLASVAVFETFGPPLTRWGLLMTGEVPEGAQVDH
jgi:4-hydroxybenzoate polyprenyltransferase